MPLGVWKIFRKWRLLLVGPAGVVATLLLLVEVADYMDFFVGILSGESELVKMRQWFADHLFWVTVALALWPVVGLRGLWWRYTTGRQKRFIEEWKGLAPSRQGLRDLIPPAHAKWTGAPSSFALVSHCVGKVSFPSGLPFNRGKLRDYAKRAKATWSGDRKRVLDFSMAIYPAQGESALLDPDERKRLDEARRALSQFWDEWGRECYDEGSIQESDLRPFMPSAELALLMYLEIALALRNNDESPGKQGLFRLAQAASPKGLPPVRPKRTKKYYFVT